MRRMIPIEREKITRREILIKYMITMKRMDVMNTMMISREREEI